MSVVTIQIGQCGNQIGEKLFETLFSDCYDLPNASRLNRKLANENELYVSESMARFFTQDESLTREVKLSSSDCESSLFARSVLIDMESKVVNKLLYNNSSKRQWSFRQSNSYTQKKGSGNNWYSFWQPIFYNLFKSLKTKF
jgi:hypothetical protein